MATGWGKDDGRESASEHLGKVPVPVIWVTGPEGLGSRGRSGCLPLGGGGLLPPPFRRGGARQPPAPRPAAPYLAGAGAWAGMPRLGAGRATRTANWAGRGVTSEPRGSGSGDARGPEHPDSESECGCGVCRGSVPQASARGELRGPALRAPPAALLCWAGAAAPRGGDPSDAGETRPGSGVDSGRPGAGGWRAGWGVGVVGARGPAQPSGLKWGRRDSASCPVRGAGQRVGGALGLAEGVLLAKPPARISSSVPEPPLLPLPHGSPSSRGHPLDLIAFPPTSRC